MPQDKGGYGFHPMLRSTGDGEPLWAKLRPGNAAWTALCVISLALVSWFQALRLSGALAKAAPKRLRWQLWHTPARIVRTARRTTARLADHHPGTPALLAAAHNQPPHQHRQPKPTTAKIGDTASEFIGCYSGRVQSCELDAGLGICWRRDVIETKGPLSQGLSARVGRQARGDAVRHSERQSATALRRGAGCLLRRPDRRLLDVGEDVSGGDQPFATARTTGSTVLYTEAGRLSPEAEAVLHDYQPARIVSIGGHAAITDDAKNRVRSVVPDAAAPRYSGSTRTQTAAFVARRILGSP
ncbi:hypothetical protein [Candidatus Poriferisodalis sp.]|uniref:hypothetical protein n=1 Tax=Candidatus Poriferisodalis sp. TaxID=3101277 RepID=UPI003B02486B